MWEQVARQQHGLVSRDQLHAEAMSVWSISRRVRSCQLEMVLPGVYRIPGSPRTWLQSLMGVCLWAGEGAAASHRAAAALWGLDGFREGPLEVSACKKNQLSTRFKVHRPAVEPRFITVVKAIPVTSATRTVIDLASSLRERQLGRVIDDALRQGLTSLGALGAFAGRCDGRPGIRLLRELLAKRGPDYGPSVSELQRLVRDLLVETGLTGFEEEFEIRGQDGRFLGRPDFVYPSQRVIVEADSVRNHAGAVDFAEDLDRRNRLTAEHWLMLHVTWDDLLHRRAQRVQQVRQALEDQSSQHAQLGSCASSPRRGQDLRRT